MDVETFGDLNDLNRSRVSDILLHVKSLSSQLVISVTVTVEIHKKSFTSTSSSTLTLVLCFYFYAHRCALG